MPMIIRRYIFKEFFAPFSVSLIFFSFVFLMTQLPEITNYVVNYKIGLTTVGLLLLYSMPYFLQFTIPMAVMIGVLLTFLRMSADMEIVALRASGVHVYRLLPPVLLFGVLGTLLAAFMSIYGIPAGRVHSKQLLINFAAAHADVGIKPRQFIDVYKDVIICVNDMVNATISMKDVLIEDRRSSRLSNTIIASRGHFSFDAEESVAALRLYRGSIYQVDLSQQRANEIDFETYDLRLDTSRNYENLQKGGRHVQEMSLSELRKAISSAPKKNKAYYKALKEWHKKFALPVSCAIIVLLAVPLGIRARSSQRAYGIGLGLFFFLLYYVMLSFGWVLAESGVCPAWLGMWSPNAVILIIAITLLIRTANEKPSLLSAMPDRLKRLLPHHSKLHASCRPRLPGERDTHS